MVHRPASKSPGPPDSRRARPQAGPRAGPTHFSMRGTPPQNSPAQTMTMAHRPGSFKSPGPPDGRQARLQAGPRADLTHFSRRCTN